MLTRPAKIHCFARFRGVSGNFWSTHSSSGRVGLSAESPVVMYPRQNAAGEAPGQSGWKHEDHEADTKDTNIADHTGRTPALLARSGYDFDGHSDAASELGVGVKVGVKIGTSGPPRQAAVTPSPLAGVLPFCRRDGPCRGAFVVWRGGCAGVSGGESSRCGNAGH